MSDLHNNGRRLRKIIGVGKCAYCGKENSSSVDHIVPLAVYKWTGIGDIEDYNNVDNIIISCTQCNENKNCSIMSKEQALRLKPSCAKLYDKLHPAIVKYSNLIYKLLSKQNRRCHLCGRCIDIKTASIRRIDDKAERTVDNAVLICKRCNFKWRQYRK